MVTNRSIATAAAIIATLALPLPSLATTTTSAPPQQYNFETRIVPQYGAGEYDGTMRLTVYADGIVQGTYLPSDGNIRTVTGGLNGRKLWLDIGQNGRLRVTGTFEHGVINAVVQKPGPDITTFEADPIRK